ncbi:response regulator [Maridesulfovibrio sp.]|uniref:response regulator n=1 Tax=Maridesulfovibrio sp. TaxID=2795000 RepID=UPI002A18B3B0|nr:response regulator [Maridesulfovibrio sp.]
MKNIRVLLVDDEEGFSSVLAKRLNRRGVEVTTAVSGEEALQYLDTELYHVVILDMKMPGMDGMQALRIIKNRHPLVEVILLTGNADMDCAVQSMTSGAFDFMLKPVSTESLLHRISDAAGSSQMRREKSHARTAPGHES